MLRKASKIRYDSFGEQRINEEARRVESEMGPLFENESVVVEGLLFLSGKAFSSSC